MHNNLVSQKESEILHYDIKYHISQISGFDLSKVYL